MHDTNVLVIILDMVVTGLIFCALIWFDIPRIHGRANDEERLKAEKTRKKIGTILITICFTILVLALIGIFGPKA